MAVNKNGIVVLGVVFVDIKGFPEDIYVPDGRNAGHVEYIHGGVSRNVAIGADGSQQLDVVERGGGYRKPGTAPDLPWNRG